MFIKYKTETFKNDPTAFLPLNAKIGGQIRPDKYKSKEINI